MEKLQPVVTFKLGYYIVCTGGQSGSPIYKVTNGNYQSLGIHTNYSPTNEYKKQNELINHCLKS